MEDFNLYIRKKILIPSLILMICAAIGISFLLKNRHNDHVSYTTLAEIELLDKYEKAGSYFVELDLQSKHFEEHLYLDHTIRTFKVDPEVYSNIHIDTEDHVLGLLVETVVNKKDPIYDEEVFSKVPFAMVYREEYSDFNRVIQVFY